VGVDGKKSGRQCTEGAFIKGHSEREENLDSTDILSVLKTQRS
jgi:hypothetical protein